MSDKQRRPWTVFVHDIGPTFTFAHEDRAHARAAVLVSGEYDGSHYGHVDVFKAYEPGDGGQAFPMFRTVYSAGHAPRPQVLTSAALMRSPFDRAYGWQPAVVCTSCGVMHDPEGQEPESCPACGASLAVAS